MSVLMIGLSFFLVAVTPGPANISNAIVAMSHGRRTSLVYGVGLSFGLVFWGVITASGMAAVLQSSVYVLVTLKIVGGLYLLWLAYLSGKKSFSPQQEEIKKAADSVGGIKWFLRGIILNVSNPKTVIAWMTALSVGLDPSDDAYALAAGFMVCVLVGFFTNGMYSILFSAGRVTKSYRRINRWVNGVASMLFSFAGIGLLRSAFNSQNV